MDTMHPDMQQAAADQPDAQTAGNENQVILEKKPDGTFTCNGEPAKSIDEVLNMAREKLTGDDGGMSVEQAFRGGFGGSGVPGDMGGGY